MAVGNTATLTGIGLYTTYEVLFGAQAAAFTVDSDGELTVTGPAAASAGPVTITVRTRGGTAGGVVYTYLDSPSITVCADAVGDLLREEGLSPQSNAKTLEGKQHPDRDAQFRHLNEQARDHQDCGAPVISVDTKKKELVGPFKNNGREGEPRGEPVRADAHDFPDRELGRAVPCGIYGVAAHTGWVDVGTGHDAAAFAVESIRR